MKILEYIKPPTTPRKMPSGKRLIFKKKIWGPTFNRIVPKRKPKPILAKHVPTNAANGKRHKNEPYFSFMKRRKKCNATRRQREKNWNYRYQAA